MSDARYVTVGNTTDSPIPVDRAGRMVPAHGWGTVDLEQGSARPLIDAGSLVVIEDPRAGGAFEDEVNPDALAAFDQTDKLNGGESRADVAAAQTEAEVEAANADTDTTTEKPARTSRRPR